MDLLQGLLTRRSVRKYDAQKPVSPADLTQILRAAMYAPSAMNKRPWEFVVVTDKELLEQIRVIHPHAPFVVEAGTAVIACEDTHAAFEGCGPIDVALASENLMLAAHALGYGSCYCKISPDDERVAGFKRLLQLPDHIIPAGLIVVGTPAAEPKQPERFEEHKIHRNRW